MDALRRLSPLFRRSLALPFVLPLLGLVVASGAAHAETITRDDLRGALLDQADLPGFQRYDHIRLNFTLPRQGAFIAEMYGFNAPNGGRLTIELVAPATGNDSGPMTVAGDGESFLRSNAMTSGALSGVPAANFALSGPLGVGDDDLSAVWQTYDAGTQSWTVVYGEVFQQGSVFAKLLYFAPAAQPDPAALFAFSQQQAANLVAVGLP